MQKKDVLTYFGSPTKAAKVLGIKPAAVYQWGERIPEGRAARLDRITQGKRKNGVVLKYDPAVYEDAAA